MTAASKRRYSWIVLVAYWLVLFTATHVPRAPSLPLEGGDKLIHASAYALLTLLAAVCWAAHRPARPRDLLLIFVAIVLYGGLDELTQIPVGRTADWRDWMADIFGAACGIALFVALRAMLRRWAPRQPNR